jgi:hypothetical protein
MERDVLPNHSKDRDVLRILCREYKALATELGFAVPDEIAKYAAKSK